MASATFAQAKMESKKAEKMSPAAKPAQAKVIKMTPAAPKAEVAPTKKDGTLDKRFKANKGEKAEGPTKKDGTLDMRFKKNKPAEKKAA